MKNGVIMGRFGKWTGMVSVLFFAASAISCGNEVNPAGFTCEDASFNFSRCPSVRSCCSDTFCYYDVDGLTFDCQGTDCSTASDRIVDYCTGEGQDAATADDSSNGTSDTIEADSASINSCDPCRYCAIVTSYSSDGQGSFIAANEVTCSVAECNGDGTPGCIVNEPMRFVASASDCTDFNSTCPGDESIECQGEPQRCSVYRNASSTWDCSEMEYCNHYTGSWACPYGYEEAATGVLIELAFSGWRTVIRTDLDDAVPEGCRLDS